MTDATPTVKLNNGYEMPVVGLGTWKSGAGQVKQAVEDAIDAGYRHIDCALAYQNEEEVGAAIANKIAAGVVKREELFVVSKLWNTFHSPAKVHEGIKLSLSKLGLDYLDLYLIHWPMGYQEGAEYFPKDTNGKFLYSNIDYLDTWKAMEGCVVSGLTQSIGVSNFNSEQLQRVLDNAHIKPAVIQLECHPYLNQAKMIQFCRERGIIVTAYSPLGSPDRPWAKPGDPVLMEDEKLISLAIKYTKTVPQILLRYQIQRGVIVIPKSVTKMRIESNLKCCDFQLSQEDVDYIDTFNCNGRLCRLEWVNDHPFYPFHSVF